MAGAAMVRGEFDAGGLEKRQLLAPPASAILKS